VQLVWTAAIDTTTPRFVFKKFFIFRGDNERALQAGGALRIGGGPHRLLEIRSQQSAARARRHFTRRAVFSLAHSLAGHSDVWFAAPPLSCATICSGVSFPRLVFAHWGEIDDRLAAGGRVAAKLKPVVWALGHSRRIESSASLRCPLLRRKAEVHSLHYGCATGHGVIDGAGPRRDLSSPKRSANQCATELMIGMDSPDHAMAAPQVAWRSAGKDRRVAHGIFFGSALLCQRVLFSASTDT